MYDFLDPAVSERSVRKKMKPLLKLVLLRVPAHARIKAGDATKIASDAAGERIR